MDVLPVLGAPLTWPPAAFLLLLLVVTPGVHLVASPLVEDRKVTWTDDYPAVLVGDPALAVACAAGLWLADGRLLWTAAPPWALLSLALAVAYGWWQTRAEIAEGRYTRAQAYSPTKLYHQYIVYPLVGYWGFNAVAAGTSNLSRSPLAATVMAVGVAVWAATVVDAVRHPRVGHGSWDWATRSPLKPRP